MKSRNTHSHALSFAHCVHTLRQDIIYIRVRRQIFPVSRVVRSRISIVCVSELQRTNASHRDNN